MHEKISISTAHLSFYQVEGNIHLKVLDEGQIKRIDINEGDIYLLPSNIPHSPQRAPTP